MIKYCAVIKKGNVFDVGQLSEEIRTANRREENRMNPESKSRKKIFTIPNLLSAFRLILIPFFVWAYCVGEAYLLAAGILLLSGITDMADGFIARRFHMVSDLGKMLDPVADKLTQIAMLFCLTTRFPMMWFPLVLSAVKEISVGITSLLVIRKSGIVTGAVWHGKVTTTLLYIMMLVHLAWVHIPVIVSNVLISLCFLMMLFSWILYGWHNIKFLIEN